MGFLVVGKVRTPYVMAGWLCISLGAGSPGCGVGSGLGREGSKRAIAVTLNFE